jgi:protein involved in polysaccharide export with SLBB domain
VTLEQIQKAKEQLSLPSQPLIPPPPTPPPPPVVSSPSIAITGTLSLGGVSTSVAPPPPSPAPVPPSQSAFENYVGQAASGPDAPLKLFGYNLFAQSPTTFAPVDTLPVGPDYLLGPGDELRVHLWGKVTADHAVTIDRDGKVVLPPVGGLYLSGLTFAEGKAHLEREFARYYKSSEVKMNVGMGRLRSIKVFVVGQAASPGSYTLSSLSTLINGLFAAGGPAASGTLRDIQLKRNGQTLVHFDLYDFLLRGEKGRDVRLMPEDVLFIPPVGPRVTVAGDVKVPAIYEFSGPIVLSEALAMAGGMTATGFPQRIQVERVFENKAKVILDLNLRDVGEPENISIRDGDTIRVFSVTQALINTVELRGHFVRPGTYEWKESLRLGDLIRTVDDFWPDAFLDFGLIERLAPPDYHKEYLSFHPGKLLSGDTNENPPLRPHDIVVVFKRSDLLDRQQVRITGAVNRPGGYEFRPRMQLSDLLELAGGFKRYAHLTDAELTRITPSPTGPKVEKFRVDPQAALSGASDLLLQEDDYLFVRTVPEWDLYRTVEIRGEVKFPGTYTSRKGETLSSLIERAGGYTDRAYLKGAVFTRESVKEIQQRHLNDAVDRFEQELLAHSLSVIQGVLEPESAQLQKVVADQKLTLLSKMRAAKARGRISLRIAELEKFKGSPSDITLETGDVLTIPETPQQVQVIGAVYNQTAFLHEPETTVEEYLSLAGGMAEDAEEDDLYVLKVDGTAVSQRNHAGFFRDFESSTLDPGDTVVVPEDVDRIAWLRNVRDITQILYQIAVATGVVIALF